MPEQDELTRVYGPTVGPFIGNVLGSLGRGFGMANPAALPAPSLGPTASALSKYFGLDQPGIQQFGGQDPLQMAFGQQGGQTPNSSVYQAFGGPRDNSPIPGLGTPFTDAEMQYLYGGQQQQGGGQQFGKFTGAPLPQAPKLQSPQMDIPSMFDPILETLKDPQRVAGPSTLDKVSQVLGQAAQGAQFGLLRPETGAAGVISGAGAGASRATQELRQEEQALTIEHQRAVERMQQARAGVQAQRAGAEMDLARDVANTVNKEAELKYNRDVQASIMSQQRVQPLGDGRVLITSYDPNTGQGTQQIVDTVPETERYWQQVYLQSRAAKNLREDSRQEKKFLLDGKVVPQSALFGAAGNVFSTGAQKEANWLAFQIADDPILLNDYAKVLEEEMAGKDPEDPSYKLMFARWEIEPTAMTIDFIRQDLLEHPDKRRQALERYKGRGETMMELE